MFRKNKTKSPEEVLLMMMDVARKYNKDNYTKLVDALNKVHEAYDILSELKERGEDDIDDIEKDLIKNLKQVAKEEK